MAFVHAVVEVDVDAVMDELSDAELAAAVAKRTKAEVSSPAVLLDHVYHEFRQRGDAPPALREYIYQVMGRVL